MRAQMLTRLSYVFSCVSNPANSLIYGFIQEFAGVGGQLHVKHAGTTFAETSTAIEEFKLTESDFTR
jgi:hypothetical protein